MAIRYKIYVLDALKNAGYNTARLRKEKLLSESTIQNIRRGIIISANNLSKICEMLQCQPGDIIEYVKE